jgi:hypothetical protein
MRTGRTFLAATAVASAVACGGPAAPAGASRVPGPSPSASSAASSAGSGAGSGAARVATPITRAPFVVAIVVDQLSAWVAATRWPELPADGGFARLRREGTWVKAMRLPYAVSDTGPGHASLHTGKPPSESGIVGNELPDGDHRISVLRDAATREVTPDGAVASRVGSSAARLRAETVADRLRAARPHALVVSISIKDRGAILPAGKKPTHALWFDGMLDRFVTSTAFEEKLPAWVDAAGGPAAIAKARSTPWTPSDPAWLYARAATRDDAPGEGDLEGFGTVFPHVARSGHTFRMLPASDRTIADLALAAVAAEHDPNEPTLLLLSFSASDTIGHTFGPDSWEAWDHLRKLDRTLGDLLAALEERVGPVSVLLSADHGNVSMPEAAPARAAIPGCRGVAQNATDATGASGAKGASGARAQPRPHAKDDPWDRPCFAGHRIGPKAIGDELKAAVAKAFPKQDLVAGVADPWVYLTPTARALPPARRAALDRVIRATLGKHADAIAKVYDVATLAAECPAALAKARGIPERAKPGEDVLTLVCRSWSPGAGGDYYVVVEYGSFWESEIVTNKGTSHGSPYLYDRTIPMLVRSAAAAHGDLDAGAVIEAPVDFTAYSALEAHFVGLDPRPARDILRALTAR